MPDGQKLIVTGIPRSGTTLASAIIDGFPDTVCLNEPGWHTARSARDGQGFAQFIDEDFDRLHTRFLRGEPVPDRRREDGTPLTNYYRRSESGQMEHLYRIVPVTRSGLGPNFRLAIKHNGPYLAVLPELLARGLPVVAIVRHPVDVIHSWRSLDIPISRAELPNAVPFWPELSDIVVSNRSLLEKQVRIYDLMCRRLHEYRNKIILIAYEAMVKNPALLAGALQVKTEISPQLMDKPSREVPAAARDEISDMLKKHGHYYAQFYPDL